MELELYGADDKFYSKLDQEDALLGSYPVDDGCRIHVRPPYLGPLPFIRLFIQQMLAKIHPRGAPSPAWREIDASPDSDSQSGLGW